MKIFGIAAVALVAALVLGFSGQFAATTANADVTAVSSVGCEFLASAIDGDTTNAVAAADYTAACVTPLTPAELKNLDKALGDNSGSLTASDLAEVDALDGNQLNAACTALGPGCTIVAFAFVNDEAAVTFDLPAGFAADIVCNTDAQDADCETGLTVGDGVVTAQIVNVSAKVGDVKTVTASQESVSQSFDVTVVGNAHDVALTLARSTIETNGSTAAANTCSTSNDVADSTSLSQPTTTVAIAVVTDAAGTKLTRVPVTLASSDANVAIVAVGSAANDVTGNTGESVDAGTNGIAQFAVICGGKGTGKASITAKINPTLANEDTASADITVVGPASTITLTAAPAQIACDGSQTSTVTAKVSDASGNPVADGTSVTFSVVALGTANPITAKTTGGTATSVVTPLSGSTAGVTVVVSSGGAQASTRVDCSLPIPTAVPAGPTATPTRQTGTIITGPNTGTGGYLGQDGSAGFPMWTLVALALGSVALVAGGMVTRRAGK